MSYLLWLAEIAVVLAALALAIITYCKWIYNFWEQKNIPYLKPRLLLGNSQNPFTRTTPFFMNLKEIYDTFRKQQVKHCGIYSFTNPAYVPIDPDYIKNILTKDFQHFMDRGLYYNEKDDPLSAHLVSLEGHKWKALRAKLTPTFTSGKMKMMFPILLECGDQMLAAVEKLRSEALDIKEILGCFTTDVIGSCAFGLECNSFKNANSEFRAYGRRAFTPTLKSSLRVVFCMTCGSLAKLLHTRIVTPEVGDFFLAVAKNTVEYREKNKILRNDFMQILIDLKNNKPEDGGTDDCLTIEEIAAQAFVFFLAGFETSSTTMMFCLFELAQNLDVQQKVRNEINEVLTRHDGKITYDFVMELKYLGQVIDETLRKYPAATILNRKCTKTYKLPDSDTVLEIGTRVIIPIYGLHHDPEYYPDPEKFDPDHFSDARKAKRHPFTYIPFGEGPRTCIGMRFGLMQTKVGLTLLLRSFKFSLNDRTSLPIRFDPNAFLLGLKDKIWLNAEKVD